MNKGFTFIELMIVIAVIGILAAIAVPIYQNYIAKSQVMVAVAELNGAKPQYELIINNSSASGSSNFTVSNMFFSDQQSHRCKYAVNAPDNLGNADQALVCELKNVAPILSGGVVYLNRDAAGVWQCRTSANVENRFKPIDCI